MHKNSTKYNKTLSRWCKNKHGASKIMDTLETYQGVTMEDNKEEEDDDNYPEFPKYGDTFMGEAEGEAEGGSEG
jgi:hypothetical protein